MLEFPLIAAAVIAMSYAGRASARPWIQLALPLLICATLFTREERTQFLAYGVIVAAAFAAAAAAAPQTFRAAVALTGIGVFLVRWIPIEDVVVWREIVVLIGVLAVVASLCGGWLAAGSGLRGRHHTLCIAAAIAVAVVTPVIPARGLVFPFAVAVLNLLPPAARLAIAAAMIATLPFARYSFAPLLVVAAIVLALPLVRRIPLLPQTAAAALFMLWPWSGLLARSFPAVLRASHPSDHAQGIGMALEPAQSVSVTVPSGTLAVVVTVSGARTSRMRGGELLGRIDAIGRHGRVVSRTVVIGDAADFGFMRRDQFLAARNPPPRLPVDDIRGYGATAWLYGAGRVTIHSTDTIASLRFSAASGLPRQARFQIESIDFE